MDFVDWCGVVLDRLAAASRSSSNARMLGVNHMLLATTLFGEQAASSPGLLGSERGDAMFDAMSGLAGLHLVEGDGRRDYWKITPVGREVVGDMAKLWQAVCSLTIGDPEHEEVLRAVNRLSPRGASDHAWVEWVEVDELLGELGWPDKDLLWALSNDLENQDWIGRQAYLGGLIWETRRALTLESEFIDQLLSEWETTSVDFKREVHTSSNDEKAELIKDIVGLANTQASGRRWMIIGFDDKTRSYYGAPDPKLTQNHLEQLAAAYTSPVVDLRYEVVQYRAGPVGKLEIQRDPKKLPYHVSKSLAGAKKQVVKGQLFVRHGSQTEQPTSGELQAIQDEGDRARAGAFLGP